eukprot:19035-Eustigmatos_ZCMA.PRE.1
MQERALTCPGFGSPGGFYLQKKPTAEACDTEHMHPLPGRSVKLSQYGRGSFPRQQDTHIQSSLREM